MNNMPTWSNYTIIQCQCGAIIILYSANVEQLSYYTVPTWSNYPIIQCQRGAIILLYSAKVEQLSYYTVPRGAIILSYSANVEQPVSCSTLALYDRNTKIWVGSNGLYKGIYSFHSEFYYRIRHPMNFCLRFVNLRPSSNHLVRRSDRVLFLPPAGVRFDVGMKKSIVL